MDTEQRTEPTATISINAGTAVSLRVTIKINDGRDFPEQRGNLHVRLGQDAGLYLSPDNARALAHALLDGLMESEALLDMAVAP